MMLESAHLHGYMGPAATSLPRSSIGIILLTNSPARDQMLMWETPPGCQTFWGGSRRNKVLGTRQSHRIPSLIPDSLSLLLSLAAIINRRGGSWRIHGMAWLRISPPSHLKPENECASHDEPTNTLSKMIIDPQDPAWSWLRSVKALLTELVMLVSSVSQAENVSPFLLPEVIDPSLPGCYLMLSKDLASSM